jgi:hypothetical protein
MATLASEGAAAVDGLEILASWGMAGGAILCEAVAEPRFGQGHAAGGDKGNEE